MDGHSILLVEDNPDDQILTVRALKDASATSPVIVLEDGQEAVDFLFNNSKERPGRHLESLGVVLLDVKLPKVSGLEVLRHIRSSPLTDWLPVIIMTSSDEPADLAEAYRLGANSFVTKPINYREFAEQMTVLARYWLFVNKIPKAGTIGSLIR